jgi:hypothetical protein
MVFRDALAITRGVIDVLRRLAPNESPCIWANTVLGLRKHRKVSWAAQLEAQGLAQRAGHETGLSDIDSDRPESSAEIIGLYLELAHGSPGLSPVVVTEDWGDKPTRPSLGRFCEEQEFTVIRLISFLNQINLSHCLA